MHPNLRFALTAAGAAAVAAALVWVAYQLALAVIAYYVHALLGVVLVAVFGAALDPGGGGPMCA